VHLITAFDPIAPGEWDNFAFNFTNDVGAAAIGATSWTCVVRTPPPGGGIDPAPQAHIGAVYAQTQIGAVQGPLLVPLPPGSVGVLSGAFSVARVGGFAAAAAGATYTLEATVQTSDGRTLDLSADLPVGSS
jgi:hypothetical protein